MPDARPPWWPQDTPFPPEGGWEAWAGMRRRFMRRMLVRLLVLGLVLVAIAIVVGTVMGHSFNGPEGRRGFFPFGFLLFAGLGVVYLVVVRSVRRTAGPVGEVMEAVGRVADGDLATRVKPRGRPDDRRLAQAFNEMAERLETDDARRRQLLADLAHQLRTPLAVIRANVEAMLDGVYEADPEHLRVVLEEADVLARLLEDLRTLSIAEAGALHLHVEPSSPRMLVEDAIGAFRASADEAGVELRTSAADDLASVEVDPARIAEVLSILLDNALRHTPTGGSVEVAAAEVGADLELRVTDTGPGVPPDLLPHVFDRFVRSPDSGGTGLGLAIAASLVEAHGGSITAEPASPRGLVVTVRLPRAVARA